ncbi:hypothetical protein EYF80_003473 [Liparis tanakae]|uniref:Uncharacterized protein n=1 Tax=Liparis tanakae TaxID=230148 RepID=A0A4Z2J9N1_9TELE|nr:hypothetical protein EYF80_003473 [Liparis tanakae]
MDRQALLDLLDLLSLSVQLRHETNLGVPHRHDISIHLNLLLTNLHSSSGVSAPFVSIKPAGTPQMSKPGRRLCECRQTVFNVYFSVVNLWLSSHIWLFRLVSSQLIGSASRSDPARCSPQQHYQSCSLLSPMLQRSSSQPICFLTSLSRWALTLSACSPKRRSASFLRFSAIFSPASRRRRSFCSFCLAVSMLEGIKRESGWLLWGKEGEGEDVAVISCGQHKVVVMATADVPQVSVLVVVDTESPVGLHGGEAAVSRLQRLPEGERANGVVIFAVDRQEVERLILPLIRIFVLLLRELTLIDARCRQRVSAAAASHVQPRHVILSVRVA